jgi:hypothetical protein
MDIPGKRSSPAITFAVLGVLLLAVAALLAVGVAAAIAVLAVGCLWAAWTLDRGEHP